MLSLSQQRQENEERIYLEHFLKLLGVPYVNIQRGSDPPDFLLTLEDQTVIAIEVTEFHSSALGARNMPRRVIEEEWKILQGAITRQREKHPNLNSVSCLLNFRKLLVPPRREHELFVNELITFIESRVPKLSNNKLTSYDLPSDEYFLLQRYLKKIFLTDSKCHYISWNWTDSASFVGLNEHEFFRVVKSKIQAFQLPNIKETWVLVVSGVELSQSMGLPHVSEFSNFRSVNEQLQKSRIDKLFVYLYCFDQIFEWQHKSGWLERCGANLQ